MIEAEPVSKLHIGEDNSIVWDEMSVSATGEFINDATVTYALKTEAGVAVSGATGSLTYVAASDGRYVGTLESSQLTAVTTAGVVYYLEITATSGSYNAFRRLKLKSGYHSNWG